ncbi:MAG: MATE family efflux transporter [Clostridia bacterium]|nr:MATE family efflux transporter [Clostridia bacterium]
MRHHAHASGAMRMTEGPIAKQMFAFAMPMMLGMLFQQLYNTADSLIVGNFLGSEALAAVSSSSSLIHLMIGLTNGVSMGAGVVIARYFGAKDTVNTRRAIHSLLAFGMTAGIIMTILGVCFSPLVLRMMGTPETVLPLSVSYFRTYFFGSIAFVMYNACMGILQAVGDSRHPLQYLIISSVINVVLDLFFVGVLGYGVASAAFATAISQFVSMALCFVRLTKSDPEFRVSIREIRFDPPMLKEILQNGIPAGLTNSIISIANVVVQSNINAFGAAAMAGCGAHQRVEGFCFLPVQCFNMAISTFVSQNLGADKPDRVRKGVRIGVAGTSIIAGCIALIVYIASPTLIRLFDRTPEVISSGVMFQRTVMPFFFLAAYTHGMSAVMRGAGRATVPMVVMLVCWCVIRVTYITIAVRFVPALTTVAWAYPLTWSLSSIVFTVYYLTGRWMKKPA